MEIRELYKLPDIKELLFNSAIGLEKENIRVDETGNFVLTPHPFGNKAVHPFITTDFSESQVEIGTEVCSNPKEVYDQLENLSDIVSTTIAVENTVPEYQWPISNPPLIRDSSLIPVARFDEVHRDKETYRNYLADKYGKNIMLYCGIHYNFSFDRRLFFRMHQLMQTRQTPDRFVSCTYLRLTKNCYKYSWFPVLITAASPVFHKSFMDCGEELGDARFMGYSSMRNSIYGYWNTCDIILDYTNIETYVNSIVRTVTEGDLYSSSELYTPVRIKPAGKYLMKTLRTSGINHIELRMFDLNPLDKNGMSREDMYLIEYFLIYLSSLPDFDFTEDLQRQFHQNHLRSAAYDPESVTIDLPERSETLLDAGLRLFDEMIDFYEEIEMEDAVALLKNSRIRLENPDLLYSHIVYRRIKDEGYVPFCISCAKDSLEKSNEKYYLLKGFEDLELSTQALIKACLKLGVKYEVMDRVDNFVKLMHNEKIEYVKQATKTSRDNSSSILIMRNKQLTKRFLVEAGIETPRGEVFTSKSDAYATYDSHPFLACVIKPNFSSFGRGISVLADKPDKESFKKAVDLAFNVCKEIVVEEYIPGVDYRFLIIGDKVHAVSKRIPPFVVGDGVRPIRDLIIERSQNPIPGNIPPRGSKFIGMGAEEELHLQMHHMSFMTIPQKGEKVTLRLAADVSSGCESIDCTDIVHPSYRTIALQAAKAVGAVFCGVDLISENISAPADESIYSVTGVNFNPSIQIHCYPSSGQSRPIGEAIVRYLFNLDMEVEEP